MGLLRREREQPPDSAYNQLVTKFQFITLYNSPKRSALPETTLFGGQGRHVVHRNIHFHPDHFWADPWRRSSGICRGSGDGARSPRLAALATDVRCFRACAESHQVEKVAMYGGVAR